VTIGRRLAAALEAAASDPGSWPVGMLGFLARGGLIVLILPILTLPTPVGLATLLGPAVVGTGRLEGPLRSLVVGAGVVLVSVVAAAIVLAALAQHLVYARWRSNGSRPLPEAVGGLVAVELVALTPIVVVVLVSSAMIVDQVRGELLLPGDLAVPFVVRIVARTLVPLVAFIVAIITAEAIDGSLARRILVEQRRLRSPVRALTSVIATALVGWLVTLAVLVPGLALIGVTWQAARASWSMVARAETGSPDVARALLAAMALAGTWLGVLLLCGVASLVRAHLWTTRASLAGDWTSVGH
jgi:hypothetical protein